jgi:hypothetical protein
MPTQLLSNSFTWQFEQYHHLRTVTSHPIFKLSFEDLSSFCCIFCRFMFGLFVSTLEYLSVSSGCAHCSHSVSSHFSSSWYIVSRLLLVYLMSQCMCPWYLKLTLINFTIYYFTVLSFKARVTFTLVWLVITIYTDTVDTRIWHTSYKNSSRKSNLSTWEYFFFRIIEVLFQYYITSYFVNLEWVWKGNIPITSPKQNICIF